MSLIQRQKATGETAKLPLDGDIQVGNVLEDVVAQLLVPLFAQVRNKGLGRQLRPKTVRR
jgi:hypothetical protein